MTAPFAVRTDRPSYALIVNPAAGTGAGRARAETLSRALSADHRVEVLETRGRGDATHLAQAQGGRFDRVIAIGGDGTLNEVLAGVLKIGTSADTRPGLGFLPGGTANVATRALGFVSEPEELARALPGMPARPVDVGVVDIDGVERPFLLWCGAGLDAVVIRELNASRTGHMGVFGLVRNAPRVLGSVVRYGERTIGVEVDGVETSPAASVILANVGVMAFGATVHPRASPFDGVVDVVLVERAGATSALACAARMLWSSLTASPGVSHCTARKVTLRAADAVPVQVDGEPAGNLPVDVRMAPAAVRLLVPSSAICSRAGPDAS